MIASVNAVWSDKETERLESLARNRLRDSGYHTLRRVSCEMDGKVLRLGGRVSSYYEKQLAQSLILPHLAADVVLENQLEVRKRR